MAGQVTAAEAVGLVADCVIAIATAMYALLYSLRLEARAADRATRHGAADERPGQLPPD